MKEQCKQYLTTAMRDENNTVIRQRFRAFVTPENADLIVEITAAMASSESSRQNELASSSAPLAVAPTPVSLALHRSLAAAPPRASRQGASSVQGLDEGFAMAQMQQPAPAVRAAPPVMSIASIAPPPLPAAIVTVPSLPVPSAVVNPQLPLMSLFVPPALNTSAAHAPSSATPGSAPGPLTNRSPSSSQQIGGAATPAAAVLNNASASPASATAVNTGAAAAAASQSVTGVAHPRPEFGSLDEMDADDAIASTCLGSIMRCVVHVT